MMSTASPSTPAPARVLRSSEGVATGPVSDEAIRTLGAAIHAELRETLAPEDVVRLATDLLGRVTAELQAARLDRT
jgi:hypothetical protein